MQSDIKSYSKQGTVTMLALIIIAILAIGVVTVVFFLPLPPILRQIEINTNGIRNIAIQSVSIIQIDWVEELNTSSLRMDQANRTTLQEMNTLIRVSAFGKDMMLKLKQQQVEKTEMYKNLYSQLNSSQQLQLQQSISLQNSQLNKSNMQLTAMPIKYCQKRLQFAIKSESDLRKFAFINFIKMIFVAFADEEKTMKIVNYPEFEKLRHEYSHALLIKQLINFGCRYAAIIPKSWLKGQIQLEINEQQQISTNQPKLNALQNQGNSSSSQSSTGSADKVDELGGFKMIRQLMMQEENVAAYQTQGDVILKPLKQVLMAEINSDDTAQFVMKWHVEHIRTMDQILSDYIVNHCPSQLLNQLLNEELTLTYSIDFQSRSKLNIKDEQNGQEQINFRAFSPFLSKRSEATPFQASLNTNNSNDNTLNYSKDLDQLNTYKQVIVPMSVVHLYNQTIQVTLLEKDLFEEVIQQIKRCEIINGKYAEGIKQINKKLTSEVQTSENQEMIMNDDGGANDFAKIFYDKDFINITNLRTIHK